MNNDAQRLNEVFFYGLYMDPDILAAKNVEARNPRIAFARGFKLRIGHMATLLRETDALAHGMLYSLTHREIDLLYAQAGLDMYVAESILVECSNGEHIAALCCNLLQPPAEHEQNADYQAKLIACMNKLQVPCII